jgi:hypothetical protein
VYRADLFLGALLVTLAFGCLCTISTSKFELDRMDPLQHHTLDNVRWLERSDNMANKPSFEKDSGTYVKTTKDVLRILQVCEQNNLVYTELLGALVQGNGSASI